MSAFTLVELLVVILIIGILIGILIPVVTKIKTRGYAAASLAQINGLRGAIEAYQATYNAYPGPLPDHHMYQLPPGAPPLPAGVGPTGPNSQMTMSENMVLGLMGALKDVNGTITYDAADLGSGPRSLNPGAPGQHPAFYNNTNELTKGFFSDKVDNAGVPVPSCFDSSVPEFVDRFSEPLPILYLRARRGAKGVMSDGKFYNAQNPGDLYQYDVRQYYSYIADLSSLPPSDGIVIGGRKQAGNDPSAGTTGLWQLASSDSAARNLTDPWLKNLPNFALTYIKHPTLNPSGTTNEQGTPRSKNSFILISAGPDRIFGTADDLTTFGSVVP
ncbi:MAG TPA: prepilin-type N-terminal cleavage/methylation domain-containing protein [Tepidisphaeraceae bacterium]|nr:prepilin-type N-terminal cleavage/methylation domain-containing protein [Tepidisphaeraceae bacterium]